MHLAEQLNEWEESSACQKVLGRSLFPWKTVKRTSNGHQHFPISHESSIAVLAAWLSCSLPPIQTELMTHDPGKGPLKAGLWLICRPYYPQLLCHCCCFPLSLIQTHTRAHTVVFRVQNTGLHL